MFSKMLVTLVTVLSINVFAADCGWDKLTAEEKATIETGEMVQTSDYSRGISDYNVSNFGLTGDAKLFDAVANYYDYSNYTDGGSNLVDKISLAEGEKATNNPAIYRVTPAEDNPFGDLYQPFNLQISVRPYRETYMVNVDYVTSPNIVLDANVDLCFAQVGTRVFVSTHSRFVGNPELGLDTPGFGPKERDAIWKFIFTNALKKMTYSSELQRENLKAALLGNMK